MKSKLFGLCAVLALVVGTVIVVRPAPGQARGAKEFFSTLSVGQMVQTKDDGFGRVYIYSYDDDAGKAAMITRITEIGADYLAVESSDGQIEMRYPLHTIAGISRLKKKA